MPGRDADTVVFNPDLTLVETHVGGNSVGNACRVAAKETIREGI